MNPLTAGRKALVARLSTISPINGYLTEAGLNLKEGWFNEVIKSSNVGFPIVVVQKAKDTQPDQIGGAIKKFCGFYVIGAVDVGLVGYEDALDDLELDLHKCLMPFPGQAVEWAQGIGVSGFTVGQAEHFPPANGEPAASVLIPVYLQIVISSGA